MGGYARVAVDDEKSAGCIADCEKSTKRGMAHDTQRISKEVPELGFDTKSVCERVHCFWLRERVHCGDVSRSRGKGLGGWGGRSGSTQVKA